MSPFEISILFHYYTTPTGEYEGRESEIAIRKTTSSLAARDLLDPAPPTAYSCFAITARGTAYVEQLTAIPLPVKKVIWISPGD